MCYHIVSHHFISYYIKTHRIISYITFQKSKVPVTIYNNLYLTESSRYYSCSINHYSLFQSWFADLGIKWSWHQTNIDPMWWFHPHHQSLTVSHCNVLGCESDLYWCWLIGIYKTKQLMSFTHHTVYLYVWVTHCIFVLLLRTQDT